MCSHLHLDHERGLRRIAIDRYTQQECERQERAQRIAGVFGGIAICLCGAVVVALVMSW